jgi:hypothetical protein
LRDLKDAIGCNRSLAITFEPQKRLARKVILDARHKTIGAYHTITPEGSSDVAKATLFAAFRELGELTIAGSSQRKA